MSTPRSPWPPIPDGSGAWNDGTYADEDGQPTLVRPREDVKTEPMLWPERRPIIPSMAVAGYRPPEKRTAVTTPLIALVGGIGFVVVLVGVVVVVAVAQLFGAPQRPASAIGPGAAQTPTLQPTATASATPSPTLSPTATPTSGNQASFVALDTTTQGTWQGVYGGAGYSVVGDAQQLPPEIQLAASGATGFVWAASTADARAPQKATNPADRVAACWYSATSFSLDINIADGQAHRLALYLLDWDQLNRSETVTVVDGATGALLDAHSVTGFAGGQYLEWTVQGHVAIQVTNGPGSVNAVVNGVFFS